MNRKPYIGGFVAICQGNGRYDGFYVAAECGRNCTNVAHQSYVANLAMAKVWATEEEACRETCGNDIVVPLASQFTNQDGVIQ